MTKIRHCDNDHEWKVLGGMDGEDSVSAGVEVVTHAGVDGCGFESRLSMVSDRHLSKQAIWVRAVTLLSLNFLLTVILQTS